MPHLAPMARLILYQASHQSPSSSRTSLRFSPELHYIEGGVRFASNDNSCGRRHSAAASRSCRLGLWSILEVLSFESRDCFSPDFAVCFHWCCCRKSDFCRFLPSPQKVALQQFKISNIRFANVSCTSYFIKIYKSCLSNGFNLCTIWQNKKLKLKYRHETMKRIQNVPGLSAEINLFLLRWGSRQEFADLLPFLSSKKAITW